MKKRAILIVGVALLLAAAGVVYAHWTDTLRVNANVSTGFLDMVWSTFGTDDDGNPNNDPSGNDDGLFEVVNNTYNGNGAASSADPSEAYSSVGYPTGTLDRYDKDVGICTAVASGDTLTITIDNAYPSYHCTVFGTFTNGGTVPVKYAGVSMEFRKNGALVTPWDWGFFDELVTADSWPGGCYDRVQRPPLGFADQIDPGDTGPFFMTFHLWPSQGTAGQVDPGDSYQIIINQYFVNWNEWNDSFCHWTINGEVIF